MTRRLSSLRLLAVLATVAVVGVSAAACTPAVPTDITSTSAAVSDPNDVPADDTDYSVDAGNDVPEYEYEAEPAAPDSVVATLCNLNRQYISSFRTEQAGSAVVDDNLRTNLVGFSDLLGSWETLRTQYPELVPDIDTAEAVYKAWDQALLSNDNGDESESDASMLEAESLLNELPEDAPAGC